MHEKANNSGLRVTLNSKAVGSKHKIDKTRQILFKLKYFDKYFFIPKQPTKNIKEFPK